jgi:hypothetical protein
VRVAAELLIVVSERTPELEALTIIRLLNRINSHKVMEMLKEGAEAGLASDAHKWLFWGKLPDR